MSNKRWLVFAIVLFGLSFAFGLSTPPDLGSMLAEDFAAFAELSELLAPYEVSTAIFIFVKNASAVLFSFILSPFLLLMPLLALVVNGWLLGFVSLIVSRQESIGFVLVGILPHGVFELTAFFIAQAAALSFGAAVILTLLKKRERSLLLPNFKRNLRHVLMALILLVPAAIIETFLTPLLLGQ